MSLGISKLSGSDMMAPMSARHTDAKATRPKVAALTEFPKSGARQRYRNQGAEAYGDEQRDRGALCAERGNSRLAATDTGIRPNKIPAEV